MNRACPFCKSTDLDLLVQTMGGKRDTRNYHAALACKNCHARGPRILFNATIEERRNPAYMKNIERQAVAAWNIRL